MLLILFFFFSSFFFRIQSKVPLESVFFSVLGVWIGPKGFSSLIKRQLLSIRKQMIWFIYQRSQV